MWNGILHSTQALVQEMFKLEQNKLNVPLLMVCALTNAGTSFQVFKNLKLFLENKQPGDELFDRLNVSTSTLRFRTRVQRLKQ